MWYNEFGSSFWLTIAGIVSGLFGLLINACIKSRCKMVKLCCLECDRDTDAEDREAMQSRNENVV